MNTEKHEIKCPHCKKQVPILVIREQCDRPHYDPYWYRPYWPIPQHVPYFTLSTSGTEGRDSSSTLRIQSVSNSEMS